jgi:hypothetical protein
MDYEALDRTLEKIGFALTSTLVRDDFDGRDGGTTWAVCVTFKGRLVQTEYTMGAAHRHYRNGKPIRNTWNDRSIDQIEQNKRSKPNIPTLPDVLSCFVMDAQCVSDGQTFEDFAADLGYEEDSRKAEKAYNGCRDEYFGLLRMCGPALLEKLGELFQDY